MRYIIAFLLLTACNLSATPAVVPPQPEPTINQTAFRAPTVTLPSGDSPTNSVAELSSARQIQPGEIRYLKWSPDSRYLFSQFSDGSWYAYDMLYRVWVNAANLDSPTTTPLPKVDLPSNADHIGYSPSGTKALYLIPLEPTPIPVSGSVEEFDSGQISELWLWENGNHHKIGLIRNCIIEYFWNNNEEIAVSNTLGPPSYCEARAIIDLYSDEIILLSPDIIHIEGLSPNGEQLLYAVNNSENYVLNLQTRAASLLLTPPVSAAHAQWLDDQSLLMTYIYGDHLDDEYMSVGRYNLKKNGLFLM